MMREYKFRGKDFNGIWVYGGISFQHGRASIYSEELPFDNAYEVDPETVGQFIRHPDMDGVEVYKGDILEDQCTGQRFVVEWLENESGFTLKHVGSNAYDNTVDWLDEGAECLLLKAIGTIQDNPELLEVREGGDKHE